MDTYEIRRQNFLRIRDEYCEGNATQLARKLNKSQSYIHRLLVPLTHSSSKTISEKTAKQITDAFSLPIGWMDISDKQANINPKTTRTAIEWSIVDYDDEYCMIEKIENPILVHIAPTISEVTLYQVLTDKYYPRIKYGEFVIVVLQPEPISGIDSLLCITSKENKNLCHFSVIESARNGIVRTTDLVNPDKPKSYTLGAEEILSHQLLAIVDPSFFTI